MVSWRTMGAISAVAVGQIAKTGLTASAVVGDGLVTGLTGMAKRASALIPHPALIGVVLGLGFSFM